ncbi:hypothetical protein LLG96_09165 [bacterium]|nr:hypothetical protein [bacterium]
MKTTIIIPVIISFIILMICVSCGKDEKTENTPNIAPSQTVQSPMGRKPVEMETSTRIACESTIGGGYDIYTMRADGTDPVRLTANQGRNRFPAWSPDGSKIVFVSNRRIPQFYDILIMNSDGSNQTKIVDGFGWNGHPSWSPDGTKIAYDTGIDKNLEIYVMNTDGSNRVNLTRNPDWDSMPCWSPDGSKIAFVSERDGNQEIYVMNADGSNQVNLTRNETGDSLPSWSPDGTKIAFVSDRDFVPVEDVKPPSRDEVILGDEYLEKAMKAKRKTDIFVMNADGSNPVNLTNYPNNDTKPTWSPDGSRIAFISIRNAKRELFTMAADGSDVQQLTKNEDMEEYPAWSPFLKK